MKLRRVKSWQKGNQDESNGSIARGKFYLVDILRIRGVKMFRRTIMKDNFPAAAEGEGQRDGE